MWGQYIVIEFVIKNNFIRNCFYSTIIYAIHLQYNLWIYLYEYIYTKNDYRKNYLYPTTLTIDLNYEPVFKYWYGFL